MGILSTISNMKKVVTGSKLYNEAKKVAKSIKDVGSKIIGGIVGGDGKENIISRAYSSIKSYGSIALGAVFPNMDDKTLTSLQSVTSSAQQSGGTEFVETFGKSIRVAGGQVVPANPTITNTIKTGLSSIYTDTKEAAARIYNNTIEYISGKPKGSEKNPAQWVVDKAKSSVTGQQPGAPVSQFVTSDELYNPYSNLNISDLVGKPAIPMDMMNQPLNVQYKAAEDMAKIKDKLGKPLYDMKILDKSRELGVSPFAGVVEGIQKSGAPETGMPMVGMAMSKQPQSVQFQSAKRAASLDPNRQTMILEGDKSNIYRKKSLLDSAKNFLNEYGGNIANAASAGFGTYAGLEQPYVAGSSFSPSQINANRMGIGGSGSAGGDFLSQAQSAFLNKQRSQLEQLG